MVADEPLTFTFMEEERHVPYIEIVYRDTGDMVTLIEVLSRPTKQGAGVNNIFRSSATYWQPRSTWWKSIG